MRYFVPIFQKIIIDNDSAEFIMKLKNLQIPTLHLIFSIIILRGEKYGKKDYCYQESEWHNDIR